MAAPISWSDLVEAVMAAPTHCPTISWMDLVEAAVSTGNLRRLKGNTYYPSLPPIRPLFLDCASSLTFLSSPLQFSIAFFYAIHGSMALLLEP